VTVAEVEPAGKRVFLHIGAPKTGTTYLQQVLFRNAETLADHGVLYPYTDLGQSFRAAHDFCRTRWFGHSGERFRGEWADVARRVREWDGPTAIVSSELLSAASTDRIAAGLALLEPAEVHVVFSARDFARQLVSDWQEQVKHRHTVTLEKFVDDLVALGLEAPEPFGELFWDMHDASRVLARWEKSVPAERLHVVTVPQRSGPKDALWTRFCSVVGLDPAGYDTSARRSNQSMGVVETELVRRMNSRTKKMDARSYDALVRLFLAERVLGRGSLRLSLPPHHLAWAKTRSQQLIDELTAAGYPVEGDLRDLLPVRPDTPFVSPTALSDAELGPAAVKAATALLNRAGRLREQNLRLRNAAGAETGTQRAAAASGRLSGAGRRAAKRLLRRSGPG
jgi:hypothetical protein